MKGYKYYVVFETYGKDGKGKDRMMGRGSGEVFLKGKITEEKHIRYIEECFKSRYVGCDSVVIINYILMEEVEYESEG